MSEGAEGGAPLWAPWRVEYILSEKTGGCIFCPDEGGGESLIVYENPLALVMLNKYPYNSGHIMIAPRVHTADFKELTEETALTLFKLERDSLEIFKEEYSPEGFNIGMNLGLVAGAGVADHMHIHIVPRWNGDTNFMPVLGETNVMPEHLKATYERLRPHFDRLTY